jgi:hypothetical protein
MNTREEKKSIKINSNFEAPKLVVGIIGQVKSGLQVSWRNRNSRRLSLVSTIGCEGLRSTTARASEKV